MKNTIHTIMLLGLLAGVSFAQRGQMPMGTNRATPQVGHVSHSGPLGQNPVARPQLAGQSTAARGAKTRTSTPSGEGGVLPPNNNDPQVPPDVLVGPDDGPNKQHQRH
jgi:hypothetical protein